MAIWSCKIGEVDFGQLPDGADSPMRKAIRHAYKELTGKDPEFIFSGWNGQLTGDERACVAEWKHPVPEPDPLDKFPMRE